MYKIHKTIIVIAISVFCEGVVLAEEECLSLNKVEKELITILNAGPNIEGQDQYLSALGGYINSVLSGSIALDNELILKSAKYTHFLSDETIRMKSRKMIIGVLGELESLGEKALEAKRICKGELDFTGISHEKVKKKRAEFEEKALGYIDILLKGGDGSISLSEAREKADYLLRIDYAEYPYRAKCLKATYILQSVNSSREKEIIDILHELRTTKKNDSDEFMYDRVIGSLRVNIEVRKAGGTDDKLLPQLEAYLSEVGKVSSRQGKGSVLNGT